MLMCVSNLLTAQSMRRLQVGVGSRANYFNSKNFASPRVILTNWLMVRLSRRVCIIESIWPTTIDLTIQTTVTSLLSLSRDVNDMDPGVYVCVHVTLIKRIIIIIIMELTANK